MGGLERSDRGALNVAGPEREVSHFAATPAPSPQEDAASRASPNALDAPEAVAYYLQGV